MTDTRLETDTIRLLPYARGIYGRAALAALWGLVEEDGCGPQLFYAQQCPDEAWRGDLITFVQYFTSENPPRFLVVPQEKSTNRFLGFVWIDLVQPGYMATLGLFYRKVFRGAVARECTRLILPYFFETFGLKLLTGFTPYRTAIDHVRRLGWKEVACLPGFLQIRGKPRDVFVAMQERP